ncbi:hypothetical protein HNQ41_000373 [Texcoconibacillus texcoconensis]|uniref:DUF3055 domain-containing protein n=1 Tax=Texcoconibacillus texcoconensis TaxID=1095777 RepID=A0A840QLJ3_9BACI|nr:hypothetical protein [Texcoconibacillus texcoconensis]
MFEELYEEMENVNVQFVGMSTETARYDFGIVFTNMFFGKPLVVCMQTGRSTLLCSDEANSVEAIQRAFHIDDFGEATRVAKYFQERLPSMPLATQY